MKQRIYKNMCVLAAVTFLVTAALLIAVFFRLFNRQMQEEVRQEAFYLSDALRSIDDDISYLASLTRQGGTRISLIAPDGSVRYDSAVDASTLESHLNRPEVARALTSGYAQSQRMSDTLGARTYYCAVRLDDDSVVRLARTTDSVFAAVTSAATLILLIAGGVFLLALVLADRMTEHLVAPLNALDLEHPDLDSVYGELSPLLLRIERQNRQIEQQIKILSARQEEFNAITGNMAEGLALLDAGAAILTVNSSALRLLDLPGEDYAGRSYLALNRSLPLQGAVNAALAGEHRSTLLALGGKSLQLYASPVLEGESTRGALLLILDVTAREQAEQLRREFSANVSHELKTPLTSISGCAEMMKNGMVRPEDISAFSQRIFQESGRLIALIEDIIRISALDEHSVFAPKETVELAALAACVAERLAPQAAAAGVSITVEGGPVPVQAVAQMMDELLYNLCENAVKYNRPGGTVDIALSRQGARAVIEVSDTGIGIAPEHQPRVFERFYRVDKSHARQTGGTGLGLSIVKHIVEYHQGTLTLTSQPNRGTCIRVEL